MGKMKKRGKIWSDANVIGNVKTFGTNLCIENKTLGNSFIKS